MNTLLILYPALFSCQSKFARKLDSITSRMTSFVVVHQGDEHDFIADYFQQDSRTIEITQIDSLEYTQITHAIVFDDGEEFVDELAWLAEKAIPTRWIKVPLARLINLKRNPEYQHAGNNTQDYEYIGRGSYWGNPHSMHEEGESREEVIRKYRYDFIYNKFINIDPSRIHELTGKRLGCFCAPAPCHGDVLIEFLNSFDDGK